MLSNLFEYYYLKDSLANHVFIIIIEDQNRIKQVDPSVCLDLKI